MTEAVRPLVPQDLPQLVELYRKVHLPNETVSWEELHSFLHTIFFGHPWYDPAVHSFAYQQAGRVVGVLGVMPRPMTLRGQPIRAVISHHFMVEPGSHALVAMHLLRHLFQGPYDLAMTDGPNDASKKLWEGLGGTTALLHSVYWMRPLRFMRYAMGRYGRWEKWRAAIQVTALPAAYVADAVAAWLPPNRFPQTTVPFSFENLSPRLFLECLHQFSQKDWLLPVYAEQTAHWMLGYLAKREPRRHGTLHKWLARNGRGEIVGACIYYLNPGGVSRVLQLTARDRQALGLLLNWLFYENWKGGAVTIYGRLDPRFSQEYADRWCLLQPGATLMHSRNVGVIEAIHTGQAWLTRLEGDTWFAW